MSDFPSTRAEAKAQGSKHYFTGTPCKRGHIAERLGCNGNCVECHRENMREYNRKRREDPDFREYMREYLRGRREDPKVREKERKYRCEYTKNNRALFNAHLAKRRAAKLQRTPAWADLDLIEVFYATARAMTEETGVPHEVDHVVPMQGESVSGLHVASNLQILTKSENSSKRNKHEDE